MLTSEKAGWNIPRFTGAEIRRGTENMPDLRCRDVPESENRNVPDLWRAEVFVFVRRKTIGTIM